MSSGRGTGQVGQSQVANLDMSVCQVPWSGSKMTYFALSVLTGDDPMLTRKDWHSFKVAPQSTVPTPAHYV